MSKLEQLLILSEALAGSQSPIIIDDNHSIVYHQRANEAQSRGRKVSHRNGVKKVNMKCARRARKMKYEGVGRNEACPCGSGLKFKKCCIGKAK